MGVLYPVLTMDYLKAFNPLETGRFHFLIGSGVKGMKTSGGNMIGGKLSGSETEAFEKARKDGDRRAMEAIIQKAHDRRLEEKGTTKLDTKSGPRFGNGDHESSPSFDQDSVNAYAKKVGITPEQAKARFKAVNLFTAETGREYEKIRAAQKAGRPNANADMIEAHIKSSTPFKGSIERGMALRPGETIGDLRKALSSGTSSLNSWTSNPDTSRGYLTKQALLGRETIVLLRGRNRTGASVRNISDFKGEDEVLVGKGAKYKVLKESSENMNLFGATPTRVTILDIEEI